MPSSGPSWLPDGRQSPPGCPALWTVPKLDDSSEAAAWLPDSRRMLFNERGALVLMDIETGRRKELMPAGTLPREGSWTTFSVTRDGRWIAYLETRREGGIWLAESAAPGS